MSDESSTPNFIAPEILPPFRRLPSNNPDMEPRVAAIEARLDALVPNLATKADVAELRGDMKTGFESLRGEMHQVVTALHKWMTATVLTIIGTVVATILAIYHISKASPAPAPSATQPIIINVPAAAAPTAPPTAAAPAAPASK